MFRHLQGVLRVGLREYLRQVWYLREFRGGVLVGADAYGNQYYEMRSEPALPFYRRRYAVLAQHSDDASRVPAEWHGWLHYTNDDAPCDSGRYVYPAWRATHTANATGTANRYVPYSTTVRKITSFSPPTLRLIRTPFISNPALPAK